MSERCICPDVPEPDPVGAGPITCTCCGQPLVITCPGECGEQHVRQSIARAIARPRASTPAPPAAPAAAPVAAAEKKKRIYKPKACKSCGNDFTPTGPRDDICVRCRGGNPPRGRRQRFSAAEDAVIRERYPDTRTTDLAAQLGRTLDAVYRRAHKLGLSKSDAYLASPAACRLRRGDHVGARHRFPKGHVPANKGLRRPGWAAGRMRETQFVKGQPGWNWRPVGAERLVDGYRYTKVSDLRNVPWTRNWRPTHVLLWESVHGPLPAGDALAFKNGDKADVRLDNLEQISRRELMRRNTVHNLPKPVAEAVQLLGALRRQINRRTRAHEEQDRRLA